VPSGTVLQFTNPMGEHTAHLAAVSNRRTSSLITPREHGAWGLLLVPLATGGAVGLFSVANAWPLVALTVAALALFWLRTPVESFFGTGLIRVQSARERRSVSLTIFILAAVAAGALASLFWDGRNLVLLLLGAAAACAFVAQSILRRLSRRTRMLAQIVGTLGLTVTAPAAYYVITGYLDRTASALWIANFLFAGNQVHFVQLRIHSAKLNGWSEKFAYGRSFLLGEFLLAIALAFIWRFHLLPGLATVAFLPLIFRGTAWFFEPRKPLLVRRLGWTELTHAIVFGALLVAGFHFGR
jgi:hypothetical protein